MTFYQQHHLSQNSSFGDVGIGMSDQSSSLDSMIAAKSTAFSTPNSLQLHGSADGSDDGDESSGLHFGAGISEAHLENQKLIVNAFHKVLSSLRQCVLDLWNEVDDGVESMKTQLATSSKQMIPLLEDLTFFLEQYHFSPSLLSSSQALLFKPSLLQSSIHAEDWMEGQDDSAVGPGHRSVPSVGSKFSLGPSYDYDTLCMVLSESCNFSTCLKLGLSETSWMSARNSINSKTLEWVHSLYKIPFGQHLQSSFVDDLMMIRQSIFRNAISCHFPTFESDGFRAFGPSHNPVIICTHLVPWISQVVSLLCLPHSSLRVGPNALSSLHPNDVVVAVIWALPSPTEIITWNEAQTEMLIHFVEKFGVWLHVEGSETILMSSLSDSKANFVAQVADSIILDVSELLQIERFKIPVVFYRPVARVTTSPASVSTSYSTDNTNQSPTTFQSALEIQPLFFQSETLHLGVWFAIQLKGKSYLDSLVLRANDLCDHLYHKVGMLRQFRILESSSGPYLQLHIRYEHPQQQHNTLKISQSTMVSNPAADEPIIQPIKSSISTSSISSSTCHFDPPSIDEDKITEYLFHFVKSHSHLQLPISLKRIQKDGHLYICWEPLSCFNLTQLKRSHINLLTDILSKQSLIIESCISHREAFYTAVSKTSSLKLISPSPVDYVGLGAIRYRPDFVISIEDETGKQAEGLNQILDELNLNILAELTQLNHIYYHAIDSKSGSQCIGLHTPKSEMNQDQIDYHIQLILDTASRIEADSFIIDRIAALVKEGIKEAEVAIQKANADRLAEKGIVRRLPIVGRVWNWWSPLKPNQQEGHTYDLLSSSSKT